LAATLEPTVSVVQECPKPKQDNPALLWFGDNIRQGIAVVASPGYHLAPLPTKEAPRFLIPVQVTGPVSFLLLAVWAKTDINYRYVKAVIRGVEYYNDLITTQATVIVGDFNSNKIWDYKRPSHLNHSGLVRSLASLGLVSAYHRFFGEGQGVESRPTLHMLKKRERPYHIDYCFVPESWVPSITSVEVGTYETWIAASDHCPLVVDVALP
jgi:exodeoxyribonuclease-3